MTKGLKLSAYITGGVITLAGIVGLLTTPDTIESIVAILAGLIFTLYIKKLNTKNG